LREGFSGSTAAAARAVVVALLVGLALTACGQPTGYGKLVGVRPVPSAVPGTSEIDTSSLVDSLNNELNALGNTPPITDENSSFAAEFSSLLTVKQSERLSALQELGSQIIKTRLAAIAQMRRQVLALPLDPAAKAQIVYLLDSASGRLNAMQVTIASDRLVDVARADVKVVATFRIYGLLLPQCHMLVAAYQFKSLVTTFTTERSNLQDSLNKANAAGNPVGNAQSLLNDLGAQTAVINAYASNAIAVLPGLTAAGYPGNRGTVVSIRNQLTAASTAAGNAQNDIIGARAALGI
jgi:hypothetical protein